MKAGSLVRAANAVLLFLLAGGVAAQAAEIKIMVSPGFGPVMRDVGPVFERATGHKLAVSSDTLATFEATRFAREVAARFNPAFASAAGR